MKGCVIEWKGLGVALPGGKEVPTGLKNLNLGVLLPNTEHQLEHGSSVNLKNWPSL